mgnify:CR=1 FL=1
MKKILLIISLILFSSSFVYADEKKCDGLKKLSKKFFKCNTKNIKEDTIKRYKNIKNSASKKTESLKLEVKTVGSKIKNKLKKKE